MRHPLCSGENTQNVTHLLPLQRLTVLLDQIKLKDESERKKFYQEITDKKNYKCDSFYFHYKHKNAYK